MRHTKLQYEWSKHYAPRDDKRFFTVVAKSDLQKTLEQEANLDRIRKMRSRMSY